MQVPLGPLSKQTTMSARLLSVAEAAHALGLPISGVEALVGAGYLDAHHGEGLALTDVKAFRARNGAHVDTAGDVLAEIDGPERAAEEILDMLEESVEHMAHRTADIVASLFPEAARWTTAERARFESQARSRFDAILTVTRNGRADEPGLFDDLADAGAAAALAGAPLPQVLLTLRVSRDLMVQTSSTASDELAPANGVALAVVLTRVLAVLDRLTDTVARGWWSALLAGPDPSPPPG